MPYRIAGLDVHKRMLAVVVADVAVDGDYVFERRTVGTTPEQLRGLAAWLVEGEVDEVVMESTAQDLASSLGGVRAMVATDPAALRRRRADDRRAPSGASPIDPRTAWPETRFPRCRTLGETIGRARTHSEFCAGCGGTRATALGASGRRATARGNTGLGVDSAQQIIAEVGPIAATFASPKHLASWVGACPGHDESAPAAGRPPRTRASDRGHCPSALSPRVEDPARRHHVRGTWAGRQQTPSATARREDDPGTPESRLSRRTGTSSRDRLSMIARVFRPWQEELIWDKATLSALAESHRTAATHVPPIVTSCRRNDLHLQSSDIPTSNRSSRPDTNDCVVRHHMHHLRRV